MAIKGILFDFWGTLIENGVFPSPVRQAQNILGLDTDFSDYIQKFEEALMLKKYKDLYEAFTAVCNSFDIEPTQDILDQLVGLWNRNKLFAKPYIETKIVLEILKKSYTLAIISDTDCFSVNQVLEKYELGKYFSGIFLSYELGKLKTNPEMFEEALDKLGLKKEEVLMVGDSLESDMAAAKNAGIKAVLVDRRGRREYPDKVRNLKELRRFL
ncbi:HAD family hydrolase [Candidatus Woesearchaeota archaeon]|nr:HAD family hydrolase [Candidatus Woesearchaeota archaeon]